MILIDLFLLLLRKNFVTGGGGIKMVIFRYVLGERLQTNFKLSLIELNILKFQKITKQTECFAKLFIF